MTPPSLPQELILQILSHLDPQELLPNAALVCRPWWQWIQDDACWLAAFRRCWGQLPYRSLRQGPSHWRLEFTMRQSLLALWSRGPSPKTVQFEPRIGSISDVALHWESQGRDWLVAGSREQGILVLCDPSTGRVDKDVIHCHLQQQDPTPVSCLLMSAHRVLVGYPNGQLAVFTNIKEGGSGVRRRWMDWSHFDAVCHLSVVLNKDGSDGVYISGAKNGQLFVTEATSGRCMLQLNARGEMVDVCVDAETGTVVCLNKEGWLMVWRELEWKGGAVVSATTAGGASTVGDGWSRNGMMASVTWRLETMAHAAYMRGSLKLLFDPHSQTVLLAEKHYLKLFDMHTGKQLAVLGTPDMRHLTDICACVWDNDRVLVQKGDYSRERRLCVVVSGDTYGDLMLWDLREVMEKIAVWREESSTRETDFGSILTVRPVRRMSGHNGAITRIQLDAFKITSASADTYLRIWDVLTGKCIRILSSRYFRYQDTSTTRRRQSALHDRRRPENMNEEDAENPDQQEFDNRRRIHVLMTSLQKIVIAVGSEIKTWDFDPDLQLEKFKGSKKHRSAHAKQKKKAGSMPPMSNPKTSLQVDARRDLKESNRVLTKEREERDARERLANKMNPTGLTEEELLQYAMMVSMEQYPLSLPKQLPEATSLSPGYQRLSFTGTTPVSPVPFVEQYSTKPDDVSAPVVSLEDEMAFPTLGKTDVPKKPRPVGGLSLMTQKLKTGLDPGGSDHVPRPPNASHDLLDNSSRDSLAVPGASQGSSSSTSRSRTVSQPIEIHSPSKPFAQPQNSSEMLSPSSSRPPSYPRSTGRQTSGFMSPSSRPRKMSLGEFMANDVLGSPTFGSIPVFPALSTYSTSPAGSLGTTSLGIHRPSWQAESGMKARSAQDAENENAAEQDDEIEETDDALFSNLRDPRGLGDGRSGGGTGSSHSGFRRRIDSSPGQNWSSVQVVPHPSTSQEDEELQYALELSLLEQ